MNLSILTPNKAASVRTMQLIVFGQVALFVLLWSLTPDIIPKPLEVLQAFVGLFKDGLIEHLLISLVLYGEAVLLATVISLALAYSAAMPAFRPLAMGSTKLRFLGLTGLYFLFTMYLSGAHQIKLGLLTFSILVFTITSMMDVLDNIPSEKYDLAHTLRMNPWQTLWEVEVLGRADMALDVLRQNAAIGWMMLGMVEAMFRSEGGIGVVLAVQDKGFHLSEVFAIQLLILTVGICQDYLIGIFKNICCPYANLILNRR